MVCRNLEDPVAFVADRRDGDSLSPSARHGALIALPYSQQQVAHCFAGVEAETGCQAIDSGYSQL